MEEQYVWPKTSISDTHLGIGDSHHCDEIHNKNNKDFIIKYYL
jgi:hypothetical protein